MENEFRRSVYKRFRVNAEYAALDVQYGSIRSWRDFGENLDFQPKLSA